MKEAVPMRLRLLAWCSLNLSVSGCAKLVFTLAFKYVKNLQVGDRLVYKWLTRARVLVHPARRQDRPCRGEGTRNIPTLSTARPPRHRRAERLPRHQRQRQITMPTAATPFGRADGGRARSPHQEGVQDAAARCWSGPRGKGWSLRESAFEQFRDSVGLNG
jgi:hypothetical protein